MKIPIIFLLLIHALLAYSQTDTLIQMARFEREEYKIQYPISWEIDTSGYLGSEFFVFSTYENTDDKFRENINLIIQDLSDKNIDIKKYAEISENSIKTIAINGEIYESSIIKTETSEFYKSIYSMYVNELHLKFISYTFIKNEKAYLLTFSAQPDKFENYKRIGLLILNSFSIFY